MKNILITIITTLIIVLIIILMIKGFSLGDISILSISQIKESSIALDSKIEELNTLKTVNYRKKVDDLESSIKQLTINKEEYLNLATLSTDDEIKKASRQETYAMEFLWNKVGKYATEEGVNLEWNATSLGSTNNYTLTFSLTGSYIGIINYIYALENDSELQFRIEGLKIVSGSSEEQLTATFTVNNVLIKQENSTSSVNATQPSNSDTQSSEENNNNNNNTEEQTQQNNNNTEEQTQQNNNNETSGLENLNIQ